ncbi:MAG: acetylglutamate kinase [Candidatus Limnocylindria bacterium]
MTKPAGSASADPRPGARRTARTKDPVAARATVVLKVGGSLGESEATVAQVAALHDGGRPLVVVHGGGPLVGEWSRRAGLETRFVRGLRVTDEPTRDVAIAVLAGLANKTLVAALVARGVPAVGLSGIDGGMLRAEREDAELGLVGRVSLVDSALIEDLVDAGRVPVIAPAAIGPAGEILNVNGDTAAGAIAASLGARLLAFVTDVPGVRGKDGRIVARLDRERSVALLGEGTILGGMIPKVEACLLAAAAGADAAILPGDERDAIERVLAGEPLGTTFTAEVA